MCDKLIYKNGAMLQRQGFAEETIPIYNWGNALQRQGFAGAMLQRQGFVEETIPVYNWGNALQRQGFAEETIPIDNLGQCPPATRLRCGNKNKMLISVQLYKNFKKGTNSICAHVPCAFRQGLSTNAKALPLSCVQCLFWPVHIVCHLALR